MKTHIIAFLSAAVLPLFAAENVPFTWNVSNVSGVQGGKTVITAKNKIKLERNKNAKWGISFQIKIENVTDGAYYRLLIGVKSGKDMPLYVRTLNKKNWDFGITTNGGVKSLYLIGSKANPTDGWIISLDGKESVELTQLSVEKLTSGEEKDNLVYKEGIVPGFWRGLWGKKANEYPLPVVKQETASPNGEYLQFSAPGKDHGFPAMIPMLFIPNKDFECSIWLRGNAKGQYRMQFLDAEANLTFGFKKEWTEYKFKGKTKDKPSWNGLSFMIVAHKIDLPAFDMGGITFRYIDK